MSLSQTLSSRLVKAPSAAAGAELFINAQGAQQVALGFDPASASITRNGNDLAFELDNGGSITIRSFFEVGEENSLPEFVLTDGTRVAGEELLATSDIDIAPAADTADSAGLAAYNDDAGSLIGGMDMLGILGTNYWEGGSDARELTLISDPFAAGSAVLPTAELPATPPAPPVGNEPATPPVPPAPPAGNEQVTPPVPPAPPAGNEPATPDPVPGNGMDRFVMHAALYSSVSNTTKGTFTGETITGNVLVNDNEGGTKITSVTHGSIGTVTVNADGTISYNVPDDFARSQIAVDGKWVWHLTWTDPEGNRQSVRMDELAGSIKDHITYTAEGPDGPYTKTVEVVLNNIQYTDDPDYSPVTTDPADPDFVYGETHQSYARINDYFSNSSNPDPVRISGSAGDDRFTADTYLENVAINLGAGEDSIEFRGNPVYGLRHSVIDGTGDDKGDHYIFSTANEPICFSTLDAGDGDDEIRLTSNWTGVWSSTINAGGGNDLVDITAGSLGLTGVLNLGTGKDTVQITASTGMGGGSIDGRADNIGDSYSISGKGYGMEQNSFIYAGDGADLISIHGDYTGLGYGATSAGDPIDKTYSGIHSGGGNDEITVPGGEVGVVRAQIHSGEGNDAITIIAGNGDANSTNRTLSYSIIDSGAGDDTLILRSENTNNFSTAISNSNITMGSGRDSVTIDGQIGASVSHTNAGLRYDISSVNMGDDNDMLILTDTVYDPKAQNQSALNGSGLHAYGGDNEILNHAASDGGESLVGDVLGLAGDAAHTFIKGGAASMGNSLLSVNGFESLFIDLADGNQDDMNLDKLLQGVNSLKSLGNTTLDSLIIKGDGGVNADFVNGLDNKAELQHSNVTIDGIQGSFNLYTVTDEDTTLQLYVQTLLTTGV